MGRHIARAWCPEPILGALRRPPGDKAADCVGSGDAYQLQDLHNLLQIVVPRQLRASPLAHPRLGGVVDLGGADSPPPQRARGSCVSAMGAQRVPFP